MYTRSIIIGLLLRHYQRLANTAKNDNSAWEIVYAHAHKQTHKQTNKQSKGLSLSMTALGFVIM